MDRREFVKLAAASPVFTQSVIGPSCIAEDARLNKQWTPPKSGVDFLPQGIYVVYSPKEGYNYNVKMTIVPYAYNQVILFGTGYGDVNAYHNGAWTRNARSTRDDMILVDQTIRNCLGFGPSPHDVMIIVVSPNWYRDHTNPEALAILRDWGYSVGPIFYHDADQYNLLNIPDWMYVGMDIPQWSRDDYNASRVLYGTGCDHKCLQLNTMVGPVWFRNRSEHTPGTLDMILSDHDMCIRGSIENYTCPHYNIELPAHGNVIL